MNDGTTLARVKAIVGDLAGLGADQIGDDQSFGPDGLGFDSLDRLELAVYVGDHFDIEIPDADVDKDALGTAAGLAAYVDGRLSNGG